MHTAFEKGDHSIRRTTDTGVLENVIHDLIDIDHFIDGKINREEVHGGLFSRTLRFNFSKGSQCGGIIFTIQAMNGVVDFTTAYCMNRIDFLP
jgi:hypothetical protein